MQEFLPYVWSYLAVGLLLSIAATVRGTKASPRNAVDGFLVLIYACLVVIFWPIFVIWFPDHFVNQHQVTVGGDQPDTRTIWKQQLAASPEDLAALSEKERSHVVLVASDGDAGTTFFSQSADFADVLTLLWEEDVPPESYQPLKAARLRLSDAAGSVQDVFFRRHEPEWYVGFSSEFVKSIAKLDKNKRARVLEAISNLAEAPLTVHGDTVKPLTGNFSGLWRYRIGDDRLVYKPNALSKQVVLLSFGARGGVYEQIE